MTTNQMSIMKESKAACEMLADSGYRAPEGSRYTAYDAIEDVVHQYACGCKPNRLKTVEAIDKIQTIATKAIAAQKGAP